MYLGWFDDNIKKPAERKIDEAVAAYIERFKVRPNVVLVNADDNASVEGVTVKVDKNIRKHIFG